MNEKKINFIIILLWTVLAAAGMINHELWRDEAQVWTIARDLSLIDILKMTALEGHPPLWHLILTPFAKSGMSVFSMQIISFLSVFFAAVYFVFKAPFSYLIKIPVVFSAGILYYLPVIPRNYALIPLFLFAAADLYKNRLKNPYMYAAALILLSNTHVLIWGLCLILFLFFCFETFKQAEKCRKPQMLLPALLLFLNFTLLSIFLSGTIFHNHAVINYMKTSKPLSSALIDFPILFFDFDFLPRSVSASLFYVLTAFIAAVFFKYSKKIFVIYLSSFAFIFFIYQKIWFNGITGQKAYILLLALLFCFWIFKETCRDNSFLNKAVFGLFVISCINSFYLLSSEIKYEFSGSKKTAEYIRQNLNDTEIFCTIGAGFTFTPLSAYLPDKMFYSAINKFYITYYDFNNLVRKKAVSAPECRYYIVQKDFYMNDDYEIIFSSTDKVLSTREFAEIFDIYKKKAMI